MAVIGPESWPFAALLAKLRLLWQPPAKCNPPSRITELRVYRLGETPVIWTRFDNGEELALTGKPWHQPVDVATLRAEGVEITRAEYRGLVRAGGPWPSEHYDWMEAARTCPECGWSGIGSDTKIGDAFHEGAEYHCPKCGHYFGFVMHPTINENLTDPRADPIDRLAAQVVVQRIDTARWIAEKAIAKAAAL